MKLAPFVVWAWVGLWLAIFGAFAGLVWVAVHFIRKFW